jgi:hypothetical protein
LAKWRSYSLQATERTGIKVKITQSVVDRERFTTSGCMTPNSRSSAWAVGMTCKTFYASTEYRGRFLRRKIGRGDVMTAAEARNEARSMLADM